MLSLVGAKLPSLALWREEEAMLLQQSQLSSMMGNSSCLRRMSTYVRFWCVFQAVRVSIWPVAANAAT